ncbi:MAG: hypothetical protein FWE35_28005 [Streptosporangiales bacterium]|nr:hypothetical protein [Streptosporangiales bacterium]
MSDFENMNYEDNEHHIMLDTRAAELERMLGSYAPAPEAAADPSAEGYGLNGTFEVPAGSTFEAPSPFGVADPDGRTEALINGGRPGSVPPGRMGFFRDHWKSLSAVAAGAVAVSLITVAVTGGGPSGSWPASVARMQAQITSACQNPDVAAEPGQVNFACATDTRQVLWVYALLTSGGNPGYVDPVTGRRGLEPIAPSQGGEVAWSLNLHQPYNAADPVMSLEVAARAINNIIGGATMTNSSGQPSVQAGLEGKASNCQRYTGSAALTKKAGYPALCARPLTAKGKQALVTDAFRQWMTGAPRQTAADAGTLFASSGDPSSPKVKKILASLPGSGS